MSTAALDDSAFQYKARILVVNDVPDQLAAFQAILSQDGYSVILAEDARSALELAHTQTCDLVLTDVVMPVIDGIQLCRLLKSSPDTAGLPVLLISGLRYDNPSVQQGLRAGAESYLEMDAPVAVIINEVDRLIQRAKENRARCQAEAMLAHLAGIVDSSNDAIMGLTTQGTIISWNKAAERIFGYSFEEIKGQSPHFLLPPDLAGEHASLLQRMHDGEQITNHLTSRLTKARGIIDLSITISPIKDADGNLTGYSTIARDISEKKRLEEQLIQEQKMNALGRMASGIAHDFANLLTAILGFCQLAQQSPDEKEKVAKNIQEVVRAGKQATRLTEQLLTFSRKQAVRPGVADVNTALAGVGAILRRLAGDNVELVLAPRAGPIPIRSTISQIQQAIVNLVLNARDAMPNGGTLTVETAVLAASNGSPRDGLTAGGAQGLLMVSDTGTGLGKESLPRIFEPFYTTKEPGKGTGLGLWTVYNVVEQAGGRIDVASTVGKGTTVYLYFPLVRPEAEPQLIPAAPTYAQGTPLIGAEGPPTEISRDGMHERAPSNPLYKAGSTQ